MSLERIARPRVLVVDDNRALADRIVLLLTHWGCEARAAYGGEEAADAAASFLPGCVLSGVNMPGMDGYRLAERLRRDGRLRGVLLVAISSYADEEGARSAGFDRLLAKPAGPLVIEGWCGRWPSPRKAAGPRRPAKRSRWLPAGQGYIAPRRVAL
jgi:CheY-like chemotaxis protein